MSLNTGNAGTGKVRMSRRELESLIGIAVCVILFTAGVVLVTWGVGQR